MGTGRDPVSPLPSCSPGVPGSGIVCILLTPFDPDRWVREVLGSPRDAILLHHPQWAVVVLPV